MCSREDEKLMLNSNLGHNPDKLKEEYSDMYEQIKNLKYFKI